MKGKRTPRRSNSDFPVIVWLCIILAASAFSCLLFGAHFAQTGSLYHDNRLFFDLFRDNLYSVNHFGQFEWWFPSSQFGWPGYYYSLLGDLPLGSPVFSLLIIAFWFLGRIGIEINSYLPVYVFYFSFLQPLVLTLGAFTFVRQFYRKRLGLLAVIIYTVFSPGVLLNISDVGLIEPTAYFLFFCAAILFFIKRPDGLSFLALCLAAMANALVIGFTFILWNALAIPLFLVLMFIFPVPHLEKLKIAVKTVPLKYYMAGCVLVTLCLAPGLMTYSQTGDLIRTKIGAVTYGVDQLKPGNPIEFLTVSLPGFNIGWHENPGHKLAWTLLWPNQQTGPQGYVYMGIPTFALAILGLISGRMMMRRRLTLLLIVLGGVICLSRSSPFMAIFLSLPSPFRANDHFSDILFRAGGFLFFVLAALNGLHALLYGDRRVRILFAILFAVFTFISLAVFVAMHAAGSQMFAFYVVMSLVYLTVVIGLCNAKTFGTSRSLISVMICALLVDTATISYWQVQAEWPMAAAVDETPADDNVGLKYMWFDYYTEGLISLRPLTDLLKSGINPYNFPATKIFTQAHELKSIEAEAKILNSAGSFDQYKSLGLQGANSADPDLADFFKTDGVYGAPPAELTLVTRTYNQQVFDVNARQKCLLFVRDGYSPYWRVNVNGFDQKIYRALADFKCVVVPAGTSKVSFSFRPPGIPWLLPLAYFLFWATFLSLNFCLLNRSRTSTP